MSIFKKISLLIATCLVALSVFAAPKRILSLAPSATKSVILLGATNQLVGCTNFCEQPKGKKIPVVATAVQVNMEKALLLKPDLVLATSLTNPETVKKFQQMGIEVVNFVYPKSFDDLCDKFQTLGNKIGKKAEAEKIIADSRKQLAVVKNKVPKTSTKPKVFFQIGANPLFTAVPNTFMNDFILYAGSENIASDLKMGSITRETVLARNPDVIIVMLMGSMSKSERTKWMEYKNLKAVKNNRVFLMDDNKTCSPTPPLFVEALDEMINMIYRK